MTTEVLAAAGGFETRALKIETLTPDAFAPFGTVIPPMVAVAPPADLDNDVAEPRLDAIRAFRIPGDVAVMLHKGTWHAGPLFEGGTLNFFNLELADTNIVDHQTCKLTERYGVALQLV